MVLTLARAVEKYSSEVEKKASSAEIAAKATGLPPDLGTEISVVSFRTFLFKYSENFSCLFVAVDCTLSTIAHCKLELCAVNYRFVME